MYVGAGEIGNAGDGSGTELFNFGSKVPALIAESNSASTSACLSSAAMALSCKPLASNAKT